MEISGDGWSVIRTEPIDRASVEWFDDHLPTPTWFWLSLERYCVAGCCGLEAFEFSHEAVRFACGDDIEAPPGTWRSDARRDPLKLANDLRACCEYLRASNAELVDAGKFCEPGTPLSYVSLLDRLATWLEEPLASSA